MEALQSAQLRKNLFELGTVLMRSPFACGVEFNSHTARFDFTKAHASSHMLSIVRNILIRPILTITAAYAPS